MQTDAVATKTAHGLGAILQDVNHVVGEHTVKVKGDQANFR